MKLLLDTHVWIWRLLEPERLSDNVSEQLTDPHNQLCLSPISVWETLVLARKRRLRLLPDPGSWVAKALRVSNTVMLPLTHEIAFKSEDLPGFDSADPSDRFLVATALVEDMVLATADRSMHAYAELKSVW